MENNVCFNVVEAICLVSKKLKKSQLNKDALVDVKQKIEALNSYFQTNETQTVLFVCIFSLKFNASRNIDLEEIASFFDCDVLEVLQHNNEINALLEKDLITDAQEKIRIKLRHRMLGRVSSGYRINPHVEQAIIENKAIPTDLDTSIEMTNESFVTEIAEMLERNTETKTRLQYKQTSEKIEELETENNSLQIVKKTKALLKVLEDRILFYSICSNSLNYRGTISLKDTLEEIYPLPGQRIEVVNRCRENSHPLFKKELVQFSDENSTFDVLIKLDEKGHEIFLDEYSKVFSLKINKDVILPEKITEKELFFQSDLQEQIAFLGTSLEEKKFAELRSRLKQENLPQGVCALFYGSPGTGKTETAYQLAKSTGRPIVHVDISQSKSCWFGESEKKIKKIFQNYKSLCKDSAVKPILLFNEADAIFSKRKESSSSNVAQTENAMQNIILEEMEKLDGILIATTNLTGNLDSAFERRFLFKVEFEKPTTDAKKRIWKSKLPSLSKMDATILAKSYDFSGGEIDNIVRKTIMDEVISGKKANLEDIENLCMQERIHKNNSGGSIGFSVA